MLLRLFVYAKIQYNLNYGRKFYQGGQAMDKIELPTNVRQIGSIETSGLRIYVEDYVFTFVQQYTQANSATERLGILVGRFVETKPGPILFISGAIEGKYTAEGTNGVEFSKKTNEYVSDMLDKYFPGLKIVGWLQSQPGYGTYLSSKNYNYHKENFVDEHQVLYVLTQYKGRMYFITIMKRKSYASPEDILYTMIKTSLCTSI